MSHHRRPNSVSPLKFEHKLEPPASRIEFLTRLAGFVLIAGGVLAIALGVGVCGYHFLGGLEWIDALVNASMILGGMGPVDPMKTNVAKLFASFYALFSGLVFVMTFGLVLSPIMHRILHKFHADENDLPK